MLASKRCLTLNIQRRLYSSHQTDGKKTCLYDLHVRNGAKMVNFCGYLMPLNYGLSIADSVKHTRSHCFVDCSHMMQTIISGHDKEKFLESLTTADIENMAENSSVLSIFTNEKGGILDDLILSKTNQGFIHMVLLKFGLKDQLSNWNKNKKDVKIDIMEGRGLIAVQGPQTMKLLKSETDVQLDNLYFMNTTVGNVCGVENCRITRCGYTGEDGVEISVEGDKASLIVERLLASKNASVALAGLGVRDAARIEAGLCLYGNEMSEYTTPVEATISFVIAKRRRKTLGFPGAELIMKQLETKSFAKKRVGLISEEGRSPRGHIPINNPKNNAVVGIVTSGCPSPTIKKNVAMGYVDKQDSKVGTELEVDFGTKSGKVVVSKLPFVDTKYYIPKKTN